MLYLLKVHFFGVDSFADPPIKMSWFFISDAGACLEHGVEGGHAWLLLLLQTQRVQALVSGPAHICTLIHRIPLRDTLFKLEPFLFRVPFLGAEGTAFHPWDVFIITNILRSTNRTAIIFWVGGWGRHCYCWEKKSKLIAQLRPVLVGIRTGTQKAIEFTYCIYRPQYESKCAIFFIW